MSLRISQPPDGGAHGAGGDGGIHPRTSGHHTLATPAGPDAHARTLHGFLESQINIEIRITIHM